MNNDIFWCSTTVPPAHLASLRRVDESEQTLRMYYKLRELEVMLNTDKT